MNDRHDHPEPREDDAWLARPSSIRLLWRLFYLVLAASGDGVRDVAAVGGVSLAVFVGMMLMAAACAPVVWTAAAISSAGRSAPRYNGHQPASAAASATGAPRRFQVALVNILPDRILDELPAVAARLARARPAL